MTWDERMQKVILCVTTLQKLNGAMPTVTELYGALGRDYEDVLAEYMNGADVLVA